MKHIGFQGGSSIFELGSVSDMALFFATIRRYAGISAEQDVLLSRIYRAYVREGDLDGTERLIRSLRSDLSSVRSSEGVLVSLGWDSQSTELDSSCQYISEVFTKYFEGLEYCLESSKGFLDDWKIYKPLRTVVCDMPEYLVEKVRPLSEYDALGADEAPYWLRLSGPGA